MTSARAAIVMAIVVGSACKRSEAPAEPDPIATKPTPASSGAAASSSAAAPSISSALQSAIAGVEKNVPPTCNKADRVLLPGAAVLRYECPEHVQRIELVAPGASRTLQNHNYVIEPWVHGFWTPLGADRRFVALRRWTCAPITGCEGVTELHELVADRFEATLPIEIPWALSPAAQSDVDDDGHPDLVVPYWSFELDPRPTGCAPEQIASIEFPNDSVQLSVDGVVSWSDKAKTFVTGLASFRSWYTMRLSAARSLAKHLAASDAGATCPMETLRTAAEIATYGRVLGEPEATLDAEADAVASRTSEWASVRDRFRAPGIRLVETR